MQRKSFRNALVSWYEAPSKFTGRPKIPGYKPKETGRNILIYDKQALGKRIFKKTGKLVPSGLPIAIQTKITDWEKIDQLRIIPRGSCYVIEVVYQKAEEPAAVDPTLIAAIDLGVNQLAAITSTKPGFQPHLVNGRPLKDLNHYYNQQCAQIQRELAKENRKTSKKPLFSKMPTEKRGIGAETRQTLTLLGLSPPQATVLQTVVRRWWA